MAAADIDAASAAHLRRLHLLKPHRLKPMNNPFSCLTAALQTGCHAPSEE
jgi:hypothetical protein